MPGVYEKQCRACDHKEHLSECYLSAISRDGSEVILPHPCEEMSLKKAGYTWQEAEEERVLIINTNMVCQTCGGLYVERKEYIPQRLGCAGLLAILLIAPTSGLLASGSVLWGAAFAVSMLLLAIVGVKHKLAERKLKERRESEGPKQYSDHPCCDSPELLTVRAALQESNLKCEECGECSAAMTLWGIS